MELPSLYLISDADRVGEERFVDALRAASAAGLGMVLLREPSWRTERLRSLAERLRAELPPASAILLGCRPGASLGERAAVVTSLSLRGAHLGGGIPGEIPRLRRLLGERAWIGYSAHDLDEVLEAFQQGASYVSFSPIFSPRSKPIVGDPRGLEKLRRVCEAADGPVYALGGITPRSAVQVREAGAAGVAVVGAILDASDPGAATRALLA